MVGARHDRFAAMGGDHVRYVRRIGGDRHAADLGGLRPPQHMHDHRQAGDIQ